MKKLYQDPTMDVVMLLGNDVISTSDQTGDDLNWDLTVKSLSL